MIAQLSNRYFDIMSKDDISFVYSGKICDEIISASADILEVIMGNTDSLKRIYGKLMFLIVENFQNILRYGDLDKPHDFEHFNETFCVRSTQSGVYICSVNLIKNSKIKLVEQRVLELNSLDITALNRLYKEILINGVFSDLGGAGLGFIEMIRQSKHKITYDFVKINNNYSYIYILLQYTEHLKPAYSSKDVADIEWFKELYREVCSNNIVFVYKGLFYQNMITSLLKLVNDNIASSRADIQQTVFNMVIETLQNIRLNSLQKFNNTNYFFTFQKKDQHLTLSTHKYISPKRVDKLQQLISSIKQMSDKDLNKRHSEVSALKNTDANALLELALLEVSMNSKCKVQCEFADHKKDCCLLVCELQM